MGTAAAAPIPNGPKGHRKAIRQDSTMKFLKNLLALIGLLSIVGAGYAVWQLRGLQGDASGQGTARSLLGVGKRWADTGNFAEATVWKFPVKPGLSASDVEQVLLLGAEEHNLAKVGEKDLSRQVEALSGKPWRTVKIYELCDALIGARMLDYSDAYVAFMPCRIALVQDTQGKLWLYAADMDLLIDGSPGMPADVRNQARRVRDAMHDIMQRASSGEF